MQASNEDELGRGALWTGMGTILDIVSIDTEDTTNLYLYLRYIFCQHSLMVSVSESYRRCSKYVSVSLSKIHFRRMDRGFVIRTETHKNELDETLGIPAMMMNCPRGNAFQNWAEIKTKQKIRCGFQKYSGSTEWYNTFFKLMYVNTIFCFKSCFSKFSTTLFSQLATDIDCLTKECVVFHYQCMSQNPKKTTIAWQCL